MQLAQLRVRCEEQAQQIHHLRQQRETLQQELDTQLQTKDQQLQDSERRMRTLQHELQTKDQQLQDSQRQIQQLTHQVEEKQHTIDNKETLLRKLFQSNEEVMAEFQQNLLQHEQASKQLQDTVGQWRRDLKQAVEEKQAGERRLQELNQQLLKKPQVGARPHETLTPPRPELQRPQQKQHATEDEQLQPMKRPGPLPQKTVLQHTTEDEQLQPMKRPGSLQQKTVMQQKAIRDMRWKKESKAPEIMCRGSAAADSNMAYFNGYGSTTVHSYDSDTREWGRLPDAPHSNSTLVVVHQVLTMVGGEISGAATDSLLSLMGEGRDIKWLPNLPAMPTKRFWTAVVCSGHSLIVAGGQKDGHKVLSTVEVLDTDTQQWSIASSLTHPFTHATISICGERLYMLGGHNQAFSMKRSVLSCSVPELLQSCQPQALAGKLRTASAKQSTIWRRIADAPHCSPSCAILCGQLVAVGGGEAFKNTSAITGYNETTDSWEAMGDMPTARCLALVAILNGKMMVVGGEAGGLLLGTMTDVVEILC